MPTRRELLAAAALPFVLPACSHVPGPNPRPREMRIGDRGIEIVAQPRDLMIGEHASPAWLYGAEPFPVLRLALGESVDVAFRNALPQHSSIHWHGVRLNNAMDGVPYLTQPPVLPGASFNYRFTPPDPGTYFFHPHCNTAEQLGRGLAGVLVVEDGQRFDNDRVLVLKDWRLAPDGTFLPFLTPLGASRSGTFGTVRTVNAQPAPTIAVPRSAHIRLRLVNADSTRICEIGLEGATVIAIDGNAVTPFPLETWRLGPAMRLDLAVQTPKSGSLVLLDYFAAEPVTLATLEAGDDTASDARAGGTVRQWRGLVEPDPARAWRHTLELGASAAPTAYPDIAPIALPGGGEIDLADSLCLASQTFWALDGKSWPEMDHRRLPPPLFEFARGQSVALELFNATSRAHPIHIHGHTMKVLSASVLPRPVHHADTVLVLPNERVQVAFVADNPGNWMIHCHVIEHQETGMMGWFRVS